MKKLTEQQLDMFAMVIAARILDCHTDQRHILYDKVALLLRDSSQNFQALHFKHAARTERGGK